MLKEGTAKLRLGSCFVQKAKKKKKVGTAGVFFPLELLKQGTVWVLNVLK